VTTVSRSNSSAVTNGPSCSCRRDLLAACCTSTRSMHPHGRGPARLMLAACNKSHQELRPSRATAFPNPEALCSATVVVPVASYLLAALPTDLNCSWALDAIVPRCQSWSPSGATLGCAVPLADDAAVLFLSTTRGGGLAGHGQVAPSVERPTVSAAVFSGKSWYWRCVSVKASCKRHASHTGNGSGQQTNRQGSSFLTGPASYIL